MSYRPSEIGEPGRRGLTTRLRFSPQVLAFMLMALMTFYPAIEAVSAFIYWKHTASYRRLDFVITELVPNEGYPYVKGHLEPGHIEWLLGAKERDGQFVIEGDEKILAAPGRRVRVWWSDEAPTVGLSRNRR
jgi:hypothetical protein